MSHRAVMMAAVLLLLLSSAIAASVLGFPASPQQAATSILYVDFTGNALPAGWFLQGSARFIGGLNPSTGAGGVQLTNGGSQEGAIIYLSAFTAQNIMIELSGMYAPGWGGNGEDIGVGFYSGGPSSSAGGGNPASPNGYYASYEFNPGGYCSFSRSSLIYNSKTVSSGGSLPSSGLNYLLEETIVTPTSVSLNALTRTDSRWTQQPSVSLTNMLTYDNATGINNTHSTLYVGGATVTGCAENPWSYEYLYWLRVLAYSTTASSSSTSATRTASSSQTQTTQPPITQYVTQTVTSTQPPVTQTQFVTQTVTQAQTTPSPVLSLVGMTSGVMMYAAIGIVAVVVVLLGVFVALRRRGRKGALRPASLATISPPGAVGGISSETAEKLRKLRRMLDLELITQEDYEEQKKRLGAR